MEFVHPQYTRITINPAMCSGRPCIRGLRFPVATLLGYLSDGMPEEKLLEEFPFLEHEDILQAIGFSALTADDKILPLEMKRA